MVKQPQRVAPKKDISWARQKNHLYQIFELSFYFQLLTCNIKGASRQSDFVED